MCCAFPQCAENSRFPAAVQPEQRHREPHRAAYPVFRIENRHGECLDSVRLIGHDREFAFAEFPAGVFQLRMSGNILPFRSRISVTINDFILFGRSQVCKNDAPGDAVEKREVFIDRHADHEAPGILRLRKDRQRAVAERGDHS